MNDRQRALISVVVPCFNEEQVIRTTYERLREVLAPTADTDFEFLFVDDGSQDRTLAILRGLQAADPKVKVIGFARNFGHQVAVTAGLEHAAGSAVVLIDADLQDPPEIIWEMLQRWRRGVDVAYGVRAQRDGETAFKLWTSKVFYRSINRVSEIAIPLDAGDFRLMDRSVVDALLAMPERDRLIRGMVAWVGFRQEAVPYKRAARAGGESKYSVRKMVRFALDGFVSFSFVPLRMAIWLGFAIVAAGALGLVYALTMRLLTQARVPGWAVLLSAGTFIGGIQLIFLGVLGEYVGRIYGEVKRRPLYVVRERLGFGRSPSAGRRSVAIPISSAADDTGDTRPPAVASRVLGHRRARRAAVRDS